jgi:general stress protein YciG
VPTEKRSFYQDRALAAAAGRKGGKARHLARGADAASPHPKEP